MLLTGKVVYFGTTEDLLLAFAHTSHGLNSKDYVRYIRNLRVLSGDLNNDLVSVPKVLPHQSLAGIRALVCVIDQAQITEANSHTASVLHKLYIIQTSRRLHQTDPFPFHCI